MFTSALSWYFATRPDESGVRIPATRLEPVLLRNARLADLPDTWDYEPGRIKGIGVVVLKDEAGTFYLERVKMLSLSRTRGDGQVQAEYTPETWRNLARAVFEAAGVSDASAEECQSLSAFLGRVAKSGLNLPVDMANFMGDSPAYLARTYWLMAGQDRLLFDLKVRELCLHRADGSVVVGRFNIQRAFGLSPDDCP